MTTSTAQSHVSATADDVYAYLSQVSNLPEYFPKMTSAQAEDGGDAVYTTAKLDDGREVAGEAWFRTNDDDQSIEWGSEGDNDYHGELAVASVGDDASTVTITLNTERAGADDDLEGSLQDVVSRIRDIFEQRNA